jgi:uncharacterized protein
MLTRRDLIQRGVVTGAWLGLAPAFWRTARAASGPATPGAGPYGPLQPPDANGIMLPAGFSSRIVARAGLPVEGTDYVWHRFPDGSATYPLPGGGWVLVCNSEIDASAGGGASAIRFRADGTVEAAYRVLEGTSTNCAGGRTPWGTWMSCEEFEDGQVWECDPTGSKPGVAHPAMGRFKHEAVAVDPVHQHVYLTEDLADGGLYRFTPDAYPDCSKGRLEVAVVGAGGTVTWALVPRPHGGAADPTRKQVPQMTQFKRGEGIYYDDGLVYVSTTADNVVHAYDTRTQRISALYDAGKVADPPLLNPDNIVVSVSGDVFVGEDNGGDDPLDLGIITPEGEVARFLKLTGIQHGSGGAMSEVTGPSFNPAGTRLYLSSQRAFGLGVVYEISGPFRLQRPAGTTTTPKPVGAALAVEVPRRRKRSKLLRSGLPIALTLDRAATVEIRATVRVRGRNVTVARLRRRVGPGPEHLRLRLTRAGRKRVGKRLRVEVRVGAASVRRAVRID